MHHVRAVAEHANIFNLVARVFALEQVGVGFDEIEVEELVHSARTLDADGSALQHDVELKFDD